MASKLVKWSIYTVLVSLVPIFWNGLSTLTLGNSPNLEAFCGKGELLLIGNAIMGAAFAELIRKYTNENYLIIIRDILGGLCIITLMLNSLWYSQINDYLFLEHKINQQFVAIGSIFSFSFQLIISIVSIILSEI
jgi:hypothetical protein